jgi:hypothetical protein
VKIRPNPFFPKSINELANALGVYWRELSLALSSISTNTNCISCFDGCIDTTGNILIDNSDSGLVLKSPDGTYWQVSIDDTGTLVITNKGSVKSCSFVFGCSITDPVQLFSNDEVGIWYDPSDLSTMFQNSDGTTAVAVGDPVGYIADKSGNGFHAIQTSSTKRPILRQDAGGKYYLEFDGSNDFLITANTIDFSATDEVTTFSGVRKESDAATAVVFELSATLDSNAGVFALFAPSADGAYSYRFISKGALPSGSGSSVFAEAPHTAVLTGIGDISADISALRMNGTLVEENTTSDQSTGNYGNYKLYIGARNGTAFFLNGGIYSIIIRGVTTSLDDIQCVETLVNEKTGAY